MVARRGRLGLGPRTSRRRRQDGTRNFAHVFDQLTCVEIKVQAPFNVVSRSLSELLLAPLGRVYPSEIVPEFELKTWPRCRDGDNLTNCLISTRELTERRRPHEDRPFGR